MKVALYIRTSTEDQNPDLQERELREFAAARQWEIAEVYSDVGSGKSAKRPALDRLMDAARRRQFDAALVWKLDRFGRHFPDLVANVQALDLFGVRFIAVTQHVDTDSQSPTGRMILYFFGLVADFEHSLIRERSLAGSKRYREDLEAGRVGQTVHSRTGKDLPPGRPKRVFDRQEVHRLKNEEKLSIRAIATRLGIGRGTVERILKGDSAP